MVQMNPFTKRNRVTDIETNLPLPKEKGGEGYTGRLRLMYTNYYLYNR